MTPRRKALRYRGDRRDSFHVGQALGPGADGYYRRVTAVTFDSFRKVTLVCLDVPTEEAPDGARLRYYGDASGAGPEPAPSTGPPDDPIEAR